MKVSNTANIKRNEYSKDGANISENYFSRSTLDKVKRKKEAGRNGILKVMLSALNDFGIDRVTEIINETYNNGGSRNRLQNGFDLICLCNGISIQYRLFNAEI